MEAKVRDLFFLAVVLLPAASAGDDHRAPTVTPAAPAPRIVQGSQPGDIPRLVGQLADPDFKVRERASRELIKLGPAAVPALVAAAGDGVPEQRRRAERAIDLMGVDAVAALIEALGSGKTDTSDAARRRLEARYGRPLPDEIRKGFDAKAPTARAVLDGPLNKSCTKTCHLTASVKGVSLATAQVVLGGTTYGARAVYDAFDGRIDVVHRYADDPKTREALKQWFEAAGVARKP